MLIFRPEPGASDTLAAAKGLGLNARTIPLFDVAPCEWRVPELAAFDSVLFSSANALRHGGSGLVKLRGLPAYAVGKATAEAARDAGFDIAAVGDDGVERLLGSIDPDVRLVHLAGKHRTISGDDRIAKVITVYESRTIEHPPGFEDIEGAVALIHSARAGKRFAELVDQAGFDRCSIAIAAISEAAGAATGEGWAEVAIAEKPTDAAVLALGARLCNASLEGQ